MDKNMSGKPAAGKEAGNKGSEAKGGEIKGTAGPAQAGGGISGKAPEAKGAPGGGLTGRSGASKGTFGESPAGKVAAMSQGPVGEGPLAEQISQIAASLDKFQEQIRMVDVTKDISDVEARIQTLPAEIEKIRSRGYAYRSYLENKAEVLRSQWEQMGKRVHETIDDEIAHLRQDIDQAEYSIQTLGGHSSEADLSGATESLSNLESKVEAAEARVRSMYDSLKNDVQSSFQQLNEINWIMDQKDEAAFDFLAGESLFLAAKAEWVASGRGKDDPDGILYLTNQRLVFEQKEKTGKRLGMFGGKQEQEVEWELPLNTIDSVEAENKGMFGGKDMLNFSLSSGQHRQITVEIKGGVDCKFWQKQIQRMVSGDADNERAIEADPEMIERLKQAPTACHVCGGTLPRLVAGQNQITCSYCGAVIRI